MVKLPPITCRYPVRGNLPTDQSLTPERLAQLWSILEGEGKIPRLFYDGSIEGRADFILYLTDPEIYAYAVYDPKDNETPLACYWLNNFIGNAAQMHFAFTGAGLPERYAIGIEACNFLLRNGGISALVGITPKPFRHAWRFALEVGFVTLGLLPEACPLATADGSSKLLDAVLTLCTPETLKPI
jgi:hypothetical protein